MIDKLETARALVKEALSLVGEEGLAEVLSDLASAEIQVAVSRLHSSQWWFTTLREAITNPKQFDSQLLCKLLDKAVPTPQSVRIDAEEGFRLIVEHQQA